MKNKIKYAALVAAMIGLFGIVGSMDYQDQLDQEAHYCQMVEQGYWPNFNPETNCDKESGNDR